MAAFRCFTVLELGLALAHAGGPACPAGLEPYMHEASPFGWPVAPAEWEFTRPDCWAERYPQCAGERQSPMNLDFTLTNAECRAVSKGEDGSLSQQAAYQSLNEPLIKMSTYMRSASVEGQLGHVTLKDSSGLDVVYEATSIHLTAPALHAVDGTRPAAELMIVHKPRDEADALGSAVVLSILFEEGGESELFNQLGFVSGGDADAVHKERPEYLAPGAVDLHAAVQGALEGKHWGYDGSVPVPPCTENVRWLVMSAKQTAAPEQVQSLMDQLVKHTGGTKQRPFQRRDPNEICREVQENCIAAPSEATLEADCDNSDGRTAACWEQTCDKSPIDVRTGEADVSEHRRSASELLDYPPTSNVVVHPSASSLDAKGHFGRINVQGRTFEATKVSVKAISSHTFDGKRYAGELLIEHELFGDAVMEGLDVGFLEGEFTDFAKASGEHRRLEHEHETDDDKFTGTHKIVVSVPLTIGQESPLLRALGVGVESNKEAIRHGNSYPLYNSVDLGQLLEASTSGRWFLYSGGPLTAGECPVWGVKYMLFQEPLEVSMDQLNYLHLQVSGFDATPLPKKSQQPAVYSEFLPVHGIAVGSCEHADPLQNDPACWASYIETCRGAAQSPVDIRTWSDEEEFDADGVRRYFNDSFLHKTSWKPVSGLRMVNNGHSLVFESNQLGYTMIMGENGFPKYYQVTGTSLKMPSEHTFNGKHFAAELQVVQKNQKTVSEYDDTDVIISSFFFDIGEESKLLKQILGEEIAPAGAYALQEQPVDLQWALGPALAGTYYSYEGSFTEPTCDEVVQWSIFETTMTLSMEQFQAYKKVFQNPGNNRPLQQLNGRVVSRNTMNEGNAVHYRYFLNREFGRNKKETNPLFILLPIAGTVLLCLMSMTVIFVREETSVRAEGSGGLQSSGALKPTTVGSTYDKL